MSTSIIPQLVKKDLMIWRKVILIFCGVSFLCIGCLCMLIGRVPDWVLANLGFTLLITPTGTLGVVLLMHTNVFEKAKSTQLFVMSLPVTVREFTLAKLLVNLPIFSVLWLVVTGIAFAVTFGFNLFPLGIIPVMAIIFLGIFVAYTCILSVSLIFQSLGVTVFAIVFCEICTSAYLWAVVFLDSIHTYAYGPEIVWNSTAITIIAIQALVAVAAIAATLFIQNRKRDFI